MQVAGPVAHPTLSVPLQLVGHHHRRLPVLTLQGLSTSVLDGSIVPRQSKARQGKARQGTARGRTSPTHRPGPQPRLCSRKSGPGRCWSLGVRAAVKAFRDSLVQSRMVPVLRRLETRRHGPVRDHGRRRRGNGNCSTQSEHVQFCFLPSQAFSPGKRRRAVIGRRLQNGA